MSAPMHGGFELPSSVLAILMFEAPDSMCGEGLGNHSHDHPRSFGNTNYIPL